MTWNNINRETRKLAELALMLDTEEYGELTMEERKRIYEAFMKLDAVLPTTGSGELITGDTIKQYINKYGDTDPKIYRWTGTSFEAYDWDESGLDEAIADASSGDIIIMPSGNITLTSGKTLAGVDLYGMGEDNTYVTASGGYGDLFTLTGGAIIGGMTINHHSADTSGTTKTIDGDATYIRNIIINATSAGNGSYVAVDVINSAGLIIKNLEVNITNVAGDIGVLQGVNVTANTADNEYEIDGLKIYMEIDYDTDSEGLIAWADASNPSKITNADIQMLVSADGPNVRGIDNPSYISFDNCNVLVESASGYDCDIRALNNDDYPGNKFSRCDFKVKFAGGGGTGYAWGVFNDTVATFDHCSFECSGDNSWFDPQGMVSFWVDANTTIRNSVIKPADGADLYVNNSTLTVSNVTYNKYNSLIFGNISQAGTSDRGYFNYTYVDNTDSPYDILDDDELLIVDTWSDNVTVNLPRLVKGRRVIILNLGDNTVTIARNSTEDVLKSEETAIYLKVYGESIQLVYEEEFYMWRRVPFKDTHVTEIDDTDSPYTVFIQDEAIICDTSAGAITVNLPSITGPQGDLIIGRQITIKNTGTNALTIDGNGAETIDGSATQVLPLQYDSITIVATSSEWSIL